MPRKELAEVNVTTATYGQAVMYTCWKGHSFNPNNISDMTRTSKCKENGEIEKVNEGCYGEVLHKIHLCQEIVKASISFF